MGTRNTIRVYLNDELKISQYGQWDGYPSGQGRDLLYFCASPYNMEALYGSLVSSEKMMNGDEERVFEKAITDAYRTIDHSSLPSTSKDRIQRYLAQSLEYHRDHGAKVLYRIAFTYNPIHLNTAGDEFQEGNYEIRFNNLDKIDGFEAKIIMEYHGHFKEIDYRTLVESYRKDKEFIDSFINNWEQEIRRSQSTML